MVTHQLQVERRTGVRRSKTDVLPTVPCNQPATSYIACYDQKYAAEHFTRAVETISVIAIVTDAAEAAGRVDADCVCVTSTVVVNTFIGV